MTARTQHPPQETTDAPPAATSAGLRLPPLRFVPAGLCIAVALALPFLGLGSRDIYLAISVAIFALAASGLALLHGDTGQLSVAHGTIVAMGAYATIMILDGGAPTAVAALGATLLGFVTAVVIGLPALRLGGHYYVLITFAAAEIIAILARNIEAVGGPSGKSLTVTDGLLLTERGLYYSAVIALIAVIVALEALRRTWLGKGLVSIRENETLARSLGRRTAHLKVAAFGVSGAIAGFAGFFLAFANRYVAPVELGSAAGIIFIMILILGGSRYWLGPIVGALIYFGLPYIFPISPAENQIAIGVVLVLVILVMPKGIVGTVRDGAAALRALPRTRRSAEAVSR